MVVGVWPARLSPNSDIARVRITVFTASRGLLIREGTGAGHGIDVDLGQAHESAIKEAETDAMKRALVTFGGRFGLSLYDRHQRPMGGAAADGGRSAPGGATPRRKAPSPGQRRGSAPTALPDSACPGPAGSRCPARFAHHPLAV